MRTEEIQVMNCMVCGRGRPYPDGFPDSVYAECWFCWHKQHIRASHPGTLRRARRQALRAARRQIKSDVADAAEATLRRQGFIN